MNLSRHNVFPYLLLFAEDTFITVKLLGQALGVFLRHMIRISRLL